jgi:hypothetical protein
MTATWKLAALRDRALAAAAQAAEVTVTSFEGRALAALASGDRIAEALPSRGLYQIVGRKGVEECSALILGAIVDLLQSKGLVRRITPSAVELTELGELVAARFEPEARPAGSARR